MSEALFTESLDRLKESFLFAAAQGGNAQDCQSLIELGANINWKNADGDTPLLAACKRGHLETIELLLAHGADASIGGRENYTPLHVCTRRGDAASVNVLLNANVSTSLRTRDGQTALDIARSKGYESIYAMLMRHRGGLGLPAGPSSDRTIALINSTNATRAAAGDEVASSAPTATGSAATPVPFAAPPASASSTATAVAGNAPSSTSTSTVPASRKKSALNRLIGEASDQYGVVDSDDPLLVDSKGSAAAADVQQELSVEEQLAIAWDNKLQQQRQKLAQDHYHEKDFNAQEQGYEGWSAGGGGEPPPLKTSSTVSNGAPISTFGYSIMGSRSGHAGSRGVDTDGSEKADEAAMAALKKLLDAERSARKTLEQKLEVFKDQNTQLLQEFASMTQQLTDAEGETSAAEFRLARYCGEPQALESITIDECEAIEKRLKTGLANIEAKKAALIKEQIGSQHEQRLCVICQENEKTVVLLPCRHLCLCENCSEHQELSACPLCRQPIAHKIGVFS